MKIIVLHDRLNNEPIVIRPDALIAVRKIKDEEQECSEIVMVAYTFIVKETIGDVISKINKAESKTEQALAYADQDTMMPAT